MSETKTKLEKQVDLEKRMEKFNKLLKEAIEETQITIVPLLRSSEAGIRPIVMLKDLMPQEVEPDAKPPVEKPVKAPKATKTPKNGKKGAARA